jgi:hypothetical protein
MTDTKPSGNHSAPQDDYIDIIDVLGFVWRAKVFVIIGVVVMVAAAIGVVNAKKPPVFISSVPVTLEVAGGISADQITAKFQSLIGRADVIRDLTSAGVGFVGGKAPFKLVNSSGEMSLEVSSLSSDTGGERALKAVKALTAASEKLNKTQAEASSNVTPTQKSTTDLETKFKQVVAAQVAEEAPFRAKLFALEARLAQKSGTRPIPATFVKGTSVGDDVMRLLGATESKLTEPERTKIIQEYSELVGSIKAIEAKYESSVTQMASALSAASGVLSDVVKGYPVLVADEGAYKATVAIGSHERYESKRALFVVLGVLLGGLLGLMTYGVVIFVRENSTRVRQIFK